MSEKENLQNSDAFGAFGDNMSDLEIDIDNDDEVILTT